MRRFVVLSILVIIAVNCSDDESNCKELEKTPSSRLRNHLFCEYESGVRPSLDKNKPTIVDIRMLPQYVEFFESESTLHLYTWMRMEWPDVHLTWEPEKWENIRELRVKIWRLWKPELSVFNNGDMSGKDYGMTANDCMVNFNGSVTCVTQTKFTSHCPTDYTEWPYDKHNCTLQIGAWVYGPNEIRLKFPNDSIDMAAFRPNNEWNIHINNEPPERMRRFIDEDGEFIIFITVMLQRHASRLAAVYIVPIIVLTILTLVVLWLDSQSLERIIVACLNFICHILGMSDLHYYFPVAGSETTPKILTFYQTSVGLAAFALVLTCLLRKLRDISIPAPTWLISGTTMVLNSPARIFLRPYIVEHKRGAGILDDSENNDQRETTKDPTWQQLASILEWSSFVVGFLVYTIVLAVVLPPAAPKPQRRSYWM